MKTYNKYSSNIKPSLFASVVVGTISLEASFFNSYKEFLNINRLLRGFRHIGRWNMKSMSLDIESASDRGLENSP